MEPEVVDPILAEAQLGFAGSKSSQLELAHIWSLPQSVDTAGSVKAGGAQMISQAIKRYLRLGSPPKRALARAG
jgi:hypothetical protein